MSRTSRFLITFAALALASSQVACISEGNTPARTDAGRPDADSPDLGPGDAGIDDLGADDLGADDLGVDDLGAADAGAMDAAVARSASVYDVQDPSRATFAPPGTLVRIAGVRITAVDTLMEAGLGGVGDVWIQEPAAGLFSGVQVYQPTLVPCAGASAIARGDVVTVEGFTTEFAVPSDTSGETVTELVGALVTCTTPAASAGALPVETALASSLLGTPASAEPYEGLPVVLTGLDALALPDMFGAFPVTGELLVDDALYAHPVSRRDRFLRLAGLVHYTFGTVRLFPRDAADILLDAPRPLEDLAGAWACTDRVDSDGDTLVDCADPDCSRSPFCVGAPARVRVQDVQDATSPAHPAPGARVVLEGPLVVTAVDTYAEAGGTGSTGSVHVQDVAAASPAFSGILVFVPTILRCDGAPLAVGDQVVVVGRYEEYAGDPPDATIGTLTEITAGTVACVSSGPAPSPALVADSADLAGNTPREGGTGEPWEGVLVEVRGLDVVSAPGPFGEWRVQGGLRVDDDLHAASPAPAMGERLGSLVGVLSSVNGNFQLEPRSEADIVRVPLETTADLCGNGVDDDVDGLADCADLDCCAVTECSGTLVLSEVVYDAPSTDDGKEWIEVLNPGPGAAQLGCFRVGAGTTSWSAATPLLPARSVAPGDCLVIGGPTDCGGATCDVPTAFVPVLPNTSSTAVPGVGLFRGATIGAMSVPVDAVTYGTGTPTLVSPSGTAFAAPSVGAAVATRTAARSVERFGAPASASWRVQTTPTPGVCTAITP
jgi:hypothetical protein